jgi:hypothetical protein
MEARRQATEAITLSPGSQSVGFLAALADAQAGDKAHALALAQDLNKQYRQATVVQSDAVPTIRGAVALGKRSGDSANGAACDSRERGSVLILWLSGRRDWNSSAAVFENYREFDTSKALLSILPLQSSVPR